jgi:hypothetical protein
LVDARRRPVKKYVQGLAIGGAVMLAVAACGEKPAEQTNAGSGNKDFKACMVSDSAGSTTSRSTRPRTRVCRRR